jgi:hypothetical protein
MNKNTGGLRDCRDDPSLLAEPEKGMKNRLRRKYHDKTITH